MIDGVSDHPLEGELPDPMSSRRRAQVWLAGHVRRPARAVPPECIGVLPDWADELFRTER